jgi:hypothetical protein
MSPVNVPIPVSDGATSGGRWSPIAGRYLSRGAPRGQAVPAAVRRGSSQRRGHRRRVQGWLEGLRHLSAACGSYDRAMPPSALPRGVAIGMPGDINELERAMGDRARRSGCWYLGRPRSEGLNRSPIIPQWPMHLFTQAKSTCSLAGTARGRHTAIPVA